MVQLISYSYQPKAARIKRSRMHRRRNSDAAVMAIRGSRQATGPAEGLPDHQRTRRRTHGQRSLMAQTLAWHQHVQQRVQQQRLPGQDAQVSE